MTDLSEEMNERADQLNKQVKERSDKLKEVQDQLNNKLAEVSTYQDMLEQSQGQYIVLEKKYYKAKKIIKGKVFFFSFLLAAPLTWRKNK